MFPNLHLLEQVQIVSGVAPMNLGTARTGDVVSLKNYRRCLVLFHKGIGPNGDDPILTLLQGTDVAFATNKALNFTTIYTKEDLTTLADVGQWTKVTQAAANTFPHTDAGERQCMWAIDIKAEDLDCANGYDCIRASLNDVGTTTTVGDIIYILYDPLQMAAPQDMPSAIID
jgi:hypothetical protein